GVLVLGLGPERVAGPDERGLRRGIDRRRRPDGRACEVVLRLRRGRLDRPRLAEKRSGRLARPWAAPGLHEVQTALEGVAVGLVAELGRAAGDALEKHTVDDDRAAVDVGAGLLVDRRLPEDATGLLVERGDE